MIANIRLLSGENDDFVLDMQMDTEETMDQLHLAIQKELGFDATQMASFFVTDQEWNKEQEIALFDLGAEAPMQTMDKAVLADCIQDPHQRFLYVFDFFSERCLFMEITGLANGALDAPICMNLTGTAPEQIVMESESEFGDSFSNVDYYDVEDEFADLESFDEWNTDLNLGHFDEEEYGY